MPGGGGLKRSRPVLKYRATEDEEEEEEEKNNTIKVRAVCIYTHISPSLFGDTRDIGFLL